MALYRLRTPKPLAALFWTGHNAPEAEEFFAELVFSVEETAESPETLTVVDGSGATRWFVRPNTYIFVKGSALRTVSREEFEDTYEEVS